MKFYVMVDMQNDFLYGSLKVSNATDLVERVNNKLIEASTEENSYLIITRDTHHKEYLNTLEGKKLPVEHCIKGTEGWEIDGMLKTAIDMFWEDNFTYIDKTTFGSFDLAEAIDQARVNDEISEIEIFGVCTDICVVSCALVLRAAFPNVKITVNQNLCAGSNIVAHEAALKVMNSCQIDII